MYRQTALFLMKQTPYPYFYLEWHVNLGDIKLIGKYHRPEVVMCQLSHTSFLNHTPCLHPHNPSSLFSTSFIHNPYHISPHSLSFWKLRFLENKQKKKVIFPLKFRNIWASRSIAHNFKIMTCVVGMLWFETMRKCCWYSLWYRHHGSTSIIILPVSLPHRKRRHEIPSNISMRRKVMLS